MRYNEGLEPHLKHLVEDAVWHYCTWLNSFAIEGYGDWDFTPNHFLNPKRNEYADLTIEAVSDEDPELCIYKLTMFNGDDGGPATLFVHAERDWHYKRLGKDFENNDYTVIYEDTFTIGFILQWFDTLYSPVMVAESNRSVHLYTEGH